MPNSATAVAASSEALVDGSVIRYPRIVLKSVKPLLPPKPVSLRKNSSMKAKVIAWVMIEKYTPLIRERNAKNPNTNASRPGTATTRNTLHRNESVPHHCQGNAFQSRNTMKSGRSLWYCPSRPMPRIRYMPNA